MARSQRTKIPVEDKVRVVLSVLGGEMNGAEAGRRYGVSETSVTKWKHAFLAAGTRELEENARQAHRGRSGSPEERRLRHEDEQLKLALAEAIVQLRI